MMALKTGSYTVTLIGIGMTNFYLSALPSLKCCFNSQRHLQDQSDSWHYSHCATFNARNTEKTERVQSLIELHNPPLRSFSEANSVSFTYTSLIRTESYGHIQLSGNLGNTVVLVEYILIPSKFGSGAKGKMNTGNLQPLPYSGCLKY